MDGVNYKCIQHISGLLFQVSQVVTANCTGAWLFVLFQISQVVTANCTGAWLFVQGLPTPSADHLSGPDLPDYCSSMYKLSVYMLPHKVKNVKPDIYIFSYDHIKAVNQANIS